MKNLRINKENFKKVISAGMILVTLSIFSGCKSNNNNKDKNNTNSMGLEVIVSDNKMISVNDLRLKDIKTGTILEDVDAILVGNKLDKDVELVEIVFNSSVEAIIIDDELVPLNRFKLVNIKTNQEIDTIDYALVGDELVPIKKYMDKNTTNTNINSNCVVDTNTNKDSLVVFGEQYEELTTERFYELVNAKIKECNEKKIAFDEEDIEKLVMAVNINKLLVDNPELVYEIIGGKDLTDAELTNIMADGEKVQDTFNDYNLDLYRKTKRTDGYILISDVVFDKAEKEKAMYVENKVNEIGSYARTDVAKMNELITAFLPSFYECKEEVYNMESGTCYGLRYILRPIRDLYGLNECEDRVTLDKFNSQYIKYFVSYVGDENEYYINGWGTGAYQNVYGLLNNNCKSLKLG